MDGHNPVPAYASQILSNSLASSVRKARFPRIWVYCAIVRYRSKASASRPFRRDLICRNQPQLHDHQQWLDHNLAVLLQSHDDGYHGMCCIVGRTSSGEGGMIG